MLMAGPNTEPNASSSFDLIGYNDQDLIMLVNALDEQEINDWSILSFDFVALGDSLIFQFVWASEEYDTFAESQYKDVFGCFISGPGLSGPYSNNAINIAQVPGTNLPVGVSTINNGFGNDGPCVNCQFYNQLESESYHQMFPLDDIYTDPNNISFNGYTDILSSGIVLQCGETYHAKLAICDVNDNILDSGVFI